jgi:hypothetical protein
MDVFWKIERGTRSKLTWFRNFPYLFETLKIRTLKTNFYILASGVIKSEKVKKAMLAVDRRFFTNIDPYSDSPQPIGSGATISAPVNLTIKSFYFFYKKLIQMVSIN